MQPSLPPGTRCIRHDHRTGAAFAWHPIAGNSGKAARAAFTIACATALPTPTAREFGCVSAWPPEAGAKRWLCLLQPCGEGAPELFHLGGHDKGAVALFG